MISMSFLGVAIPFLLFFWKQCSTNTAPSELDDVDGAVRPIRILFDHLHTPALPKPFHSLEASRCSPF
jgi:hypothetical protein